jgi:signal transduction histidine kinase
MPDGGAIVITTGPAKEEIAGAEVVEITMADTGTGIAPGLSAQIFEPFFTMKEPGRGTGLGLATCYGIVTRAGGTIRAESPSQGGACFRVRLPARERRGP